MPTRTSVPYFLNNLPNAIFSPCVMQKLAEQEAQISSMSKVSEALRKGLMKTYNKLFEHFISYDNISKAIDNASRRKKYRKDVRTVLDHKDKYIY